MSNIKSHCDQCIINKEKCDKCDMDTIMICCRCSKTCCSIHDWSNDCIGPIWLDCDSDNYNLDENCNKHLCIDCGEKYNQRCWDCEHEEEVK